MNLLDPRDATDSAACADVEVIRNLPPFAVDALVPQREVGTDANVGLLSALRRLPLTSTDLVLDVGTHTGEMARATSFATGARVIGIDIEPLVVRSARILSARAPEGRRVYHEVADAHDLPFPDAFFDGVVARGSLGFMNDVTRVVAEMHRVCRPGGSFLVFDYFCPALPPEPIRMRFSTRFARVHWMGLERWRETFTDAGFDVVAEPLPPEAVRDSTTPELDPAHVDAAAARLFPDFDCRQAFVARYAEISEVSALNRGYMRRAVYRGVAT